MSVRTLKALLFAGIGTLLLLAGMAAYGYFLEPRWVEETHWTLKAGHWKGRPLRIVVLADLHARPGDGDYLDRIVQRSLALQPDLILLLGDYINITGENMDVETLGRHLSPLMQVPCYAVLGNNDWDSRPKAVAAMLENMGAKLCEGRLHTLDIGGDTLYLSGIDCINYYSEPGEVREAPVGGTSLLLSHSPAGADHAPESTTATFCGHTHGGQVRLPGGFPLGRLDVLLQWWEYSGRIERKGKPVYISRGLGTGKARFRLGCRPELMVVEMEGVQEAFPFSCRGVTP